jgi:hypothetical protein
MLDMNRFFDNMLKTDAVSMVPDTIREAVEKPKKDKDEQNPAVDEMETVEAGQLDFDEQKKANKEVEGTDEMIDAVVQCEECHKVSRVKGLRECKHCHCKKVDVLVNKMTESEDGHNMEVAWPKMVASGVKKVNAGTDIDQAVDAVMKEQNAIFSPSEKRSLRNEIASKCDCEIDSVATEPELEEDKPVEGKKSKPAKKITESGFKYDSIEEAMNGVAHYMNTNKLTEKQKKVFQSRFGFLPSYMVPVKEGKVNERLSELIDEIPQLNSIDRGYLKMAYEKGIIKDDFPSETDCLMAIVDFMEANPDEMVMLEPDEQLAMHKRAPD